MHYFNKAIKQTNQARDAREGLGRDASKGATVVSSGDE